MNFQITSYMPPIRVMVINPTLSASQLLITKILNGAVFGKEQFIDMILLVYSNESDQARSLAQEYRACAFPCLNTIRFTSDIPRLTDADVFCFMTSFANPNSFDFDNMDSNEQFDNLYLIIKIATSFAKPLPNHESQKKKSKEPEKKPREPIIVADGLLVIDILMIIAKKLPPERMFFSTPLRSIAKTILSDFLKVKCSDLNMVYVWAANDVVFHVDLAKPYLNDDIIIDPKSACDWDSVSREMMEKLNLEHHQFHESWMKKDFIKKMVQASLNNPYGCMFKSAEMAKTLHGIWMSRCVENAKETKISVGILSDGSLGTIKGLPYVLPLIMSEDAWRVDDIYEETNHLRQEIKRINAAARAHHAKLVPICKKFERDNIIEQVFIPKSEKSETASLYSSSFTDGYSTTTTV